MIVLAETAVKSWLERRLKGTAGENVTSGMDMHDLDRSAKVLTASGNTASNNTSERLQNE